MTEMTKGKKVVRAYVVSMSCLRLGVVGFFLRECFSPT